MTSVLDTTATTLPVPELAIARHRRATAALRTARADVAALERDRTAAKKPRTTGAHRDARVEAVLGRALDVVPRVITMLATTVSEAEVEFAAARTALLPPLAAQPGSSLRDARERARRATVAVLRRRQDLMRADEIAGDALADSARLTAWNTTRQAACAAAEDAIAEQQRMLHSERHLSEYLAERVATCRTSMDPDEAEDAAAAVWRILTPATVPTTEGMI